MLRAKRANHGTFARFLSGMMIRGRRLLGGGPSRATQGAQDLETPSS